jgi:cell division protein DivIC
MALGMLVALSAQYFRTYTLARQAERLEQRRRDLVAENQALREEIHRLQTDDRYIEQLAREQLGLLKPGEVELQIVTSQPPEPGSDDSSTSRAEPSWPARVWAFLESIFRPDPVKKP